MLSPAFFTEMEEGTGSMETLELIQSLNSQLANAVPSSDGDNNFRNSTPSNPWLSEDGGSDVTTRDSSTEELLLLLLGELPGISGIRTITALPVEECERLKTLNYSLWTVLMVSANSSGDFQCLHHAPEFTYKIAVKAAVLTVMAILSFVGNAWTILSIRMNRSTKRSHQTWSAVYTLILHLSIVDLLVTLFCLAGEAAWSYTVAWTAGNAVCKIFKFLQMFSLYLSTFVLVLIGVDRFVVVKYPMKSLNTARRLNRLIIFVWGLSLTLSIPQVSSYRSMYTCSLCSLQSLI
jgi:7 transmembrane receptor (rhodopsin family).